MCDDGRQMTVILLSGWYRGYLARNKAQQVRTCIRDHTASHGFYRKGDKALRPSLLGYSTWGLSFLALCLGKVKAAIFLSSYASPLHMFLFRECSLPVLSILRRSSLRNEGEWKKKY